MATMLAPRQAKDVDISEVWRRFKENPESQELRNTLVEYSAREVQRGADLGAPTASSSTT